MCERDRERVCVREKLSMKWVLSSHSSHPDRFRFCLRFLLHLFCRSGPFWNNQSESSANQNHQTLGDTNRPTNDQSTYSSSWPEALECPPPGPLRLLPPLLQWSSFSSSSSSLGWGAWPPPAPPPRRRTPPSLRPSSSSSSSACSPRPAGSA